VRGALTPVLGFEIETYCQENEGTFNGMKGVSRVVLVNMHGERVIDTYIKLYNEAPSTRKGQSMVIKQWASSKAPTIELVRKVVLNLIRGRRLVGYHVIQKLREFKILDDYLAENASD
jgi:hypothetical protein